MNNFAFSSEWHAACDTYYWRIGFSNHVINHIPVSLNSMHITLLIKLCFDASKCRNTRAANSKIGFILWKITYHDPNKFKVTAKLKFILTLFPGELTSAPIWSMNLVTYIWKSNSAQLICLTAYSLLSKCVCVWKQSVVLCMFFSLLSLTHVLSWESAVFCRLSSSYSLG